MAQLNNDESLVRPEIWSAARRYFHAGDWDKAIFEALKKVETVIQVHIDSTEIGYKLFERAFGASPRIVVSPDSRDVAAVFKLFDGAVGIYRGDRAHGDEPAINFPSREKCLRILVLASALLDILEHDENKAPQIVSAHQDATTSLELLVERLTPTTQFSINGASATVLSRVGKIVRLKLSTGTTGKISIIASDGPRSGRPFEQTMSEIIPSGRNWHRVEKFRSIYTHRTRLTTRWMLRVRACSALNRTNGIAESFRHESRMRLATM